MTFFHQLSPIILVTTTQYYLHGVMLLSAIIIIWLLYSSAFFICLCLSVTFFKTSYLTLYSIHQYRIFSFRYPCSRLSGIIFIWVNKLIDSILESGELRKFMIALSGMLTGVLTISKQHFSDFVNKRLQT